MMHSPRRHAAMLVLVLGVAAFLAQLGGVGGTRATAPRAADGNAPRIVTTIPGGSVPDIGSTGLGASSVRASAGDVVRMRGDVRLSAPRQGSRRSTHVVCGLRYSRDGDAGWTLGTPYETVVFSGRRAKERVVVERSFQAPADDVYRASVACHVSAPAKGARVLASGSLVLRRGLPSGAATPVT